MAVDAGRLALTVSDDGVGVAAPVSAEAFGIGLGATCGRLARMYPGQHTFDLRARPEGGTEVRITLPLRLDTTTETTALAHAATADRG